MQLRAPLDRTVLDVLTLGQHYLKGAKVVSLLKLLKAVNLLVLPVLQLLQPVRSAPQEKSFLL
jgi:hypothetical protein